MFPHSLPIMVIYVISGCFFFFSLFLTSLPTPRGWSVTLIFLKSAWFHWFCSIVYVCVCVCSVVSDCDPMDCSLPGSSVHGIFQQEYWSRLPFPTPGNLPNPGMESESLASPAPTSEFFTINNTWEALLWFIHFLSLISTLYYFPLLTMGLICSFIFF